jgi:hypothetical protein
MSFFGKKQSAQSAPDVQNIHPVNSTLTGYGELSPEDTKVSSISDNWEDDWILEHGD